MKKQKSSTSALKKSLNLQPHERKLLVKLYLKWRIPIDQFDKRPDEKRDFVAEWNKLAKRNDDAGDVVHYMKTQRKRGLWVTFDGKHVETPPTIELTAEETEVLMHILYVNVTALEKGSDVISHDDVLAELIAREFADQTGRIVPAADLVGKIIALRKRGHAPKVGDLKNLGGDVIGFTDIDEVPEGPRLMKNDVDVEDRKNDDDDEEPKVNDKEQAQ
jgi:hypothetical protein